MVNITPTTERHDSCKFGIIEYPEGCANGYPICINDHCNRVVKNGQCMMCGWYTLEY